jgi:hypothetical protein
LVSFNSWKRSTSNSPSSTATNSATTPSEKSMDMDSMDIDMTAVQDREDNNNNSNKSNKSNNSNNTKKRKKDAMEMIAEGKEPRNQSDGSYDEERNQDDDTAATTNKSKTTLDLILTSEKRQNIYECDYCHQDISQQPRIRCAVCTDFDLCLDCFATSDHEAMIARINTTSSQQQQQQQPSLKNKRNGIITNNDIDDHDENDDRTNTTTMVSGSDGSVVAIPSSSLTAVTANHDSSHGYRVCDCTRYPVFATGRIFPKATTQSSTAAIPATATTFAAAASSVKSNSNNIQEIEKAGNGEEKDDENNNNNDDDDDDDDVVEMNVVDSPDEVETNQPTTPKDPGDTNAGDEYGKFTTASSSSSTSSSSSDRATTFVSNLDGVVEVPLTEDPKLMWTAEEDLRLIDAIKTHGLGNWLDVSEAISGNGSFGKTPKRCMERFFDDFLGRYGHILPPWTALDDDFQDKARPTNLPAKNNNTNNNDDEEVDDDDDDHDDDHDQAIMVRTGSESKEATTSSSVLETPVKLTGDQADALVRSSKRQRTSMSKLAQSSMLGGRSKKKLTVLPTETIPGYDKVWPKPYLPLASVKLGQEVARDLSYKAELAFVKASLACSTKLEADQMRKDWEDNRMGRIGSPTVLPPRPEDGIHLPGSELSGFMPRRGDFDVEWGNDAEQALADMEFTRVDTAEERQLKMQVLDIYCQKLDEREKRKNFILTRHLYDYRTYVANDQKLPQDERDLVSRMRMFERFHTPDEHKQFITDILKAKQLRKEIAKLQMYRRMGIKSLAEAEKYELDKNRRQFHKMAQLQREADANKEKGGVHSNTPARKSDGLAGSGTHSSLELAQRVPTESLWKQYRTNDRKARRHSSRCGGSIEPTATSEDNPIEPVKSPASGDKITKENVQTEADGPRESILSQTQAVENPNVDQTERQEKVESQIQSDSIDRPTRELASMDNEEPISDKKENDEFDISGCRGIDLLSKKERSLCKSMKIYPVQYLEIKKALIHEALVNGMLDKATSSNGRKTIVQIDVERRGNVIDFMVRAGWISRKLGDVAKRVVTPPPFRETISSSDSQPPSQETEMTID